MIALLAAILSNTVLGADNVALLNSQRDGYPKAFGSRDQLGGYKPSNMFQGTVHNTRKLYFLALYFCLEPISFPNYTKPQLLTSVDKYISGSWLILRCFAEACSCRKSLLSIIPRLYSKDILPPLTHATVSLVRFMCLCCTSKPCINLAMKY